MSRRSLQNDNKISGAKKGFFAFDDEIPEEEPIISEPESKESDSASTEKKDRRFRRGSVIAVSVLAVILAVAITLSGIDFITDGELDGIFGNNTQPTTYKIYSPDWETDIYTLRL